MPFYSPSSFSLGHPSYLPRRAYRPASFYDYDEPSDLSAFTLEDFADSPLPSRFAPLRMNAETRYRRALHELEAAEQEYEAQVAFERARQVAIARRRAAAAEAARRERAHAIQAEVERIQRTRALQAFIGEGPAQRQHSLHPQVAFGRTPCQGRRALFHALAAADAREDSAPPRHFSGCHRGRGQCRRGAERPDTESFNFGDLLELITGGHAEPESVSPPERRAPPVESQPQPQPQAPQRQSEREAAPEKSSDGEVTLSDLLDFFHSIASQARDAHQSMNEPNAPSQNETTPANEKGKGRAEPEPAPEPTFFESLFGRHLKGAFDQEMRDMEQAIKLSLQDRDATDAKKAHASKNAKSSPGASSSKVKIVDRCSSDRTASPARSASSVSTSTVIPQRLSPLTTIRAVRGQFSALESAFKFPPVLDFDHSELAITQNNAPLRAYENALNGLLEQLDAIESDGDEEVRNTRRDVVREVEKALEDVERKVMERVPQQTVVPEATKEEMNGYDVESGSEGPEAPVTVTEDIVAVKVSPAVKDNNTHPDLAPSASPADADVDFVISEEYRSTYPIAGSAVSAPPQRAEDAADTEAIAGGFAEPSDSIATITPVAGPVAPVATPAVGSPDRETFLTSMSHDQFTFPPKPSTSQSSTGAGEVHDDAVLVDGSSEGGSVKGAEDGWSEINA